MIQRLQTILLFLAAALCVAFLFLPIWLVMNPGTGGEMSTGDGISTTIAASPLKVSVTKSEMSLTASNLEQVIDFTGNTYLLILVLLSGVAAGLLLANIFLYNNRNLQVKVAYGTIILLMVLFLLLIPIRTWLQSMGGDPAASGPDYQSLPRFGLAAPLGALLLSWWAIKRIQKDEKLVKGMDRIR